MWDASKSETLQASKETKCGFASEETLKNIEENRSARLARNRDCYRALSRRARVLLRRDKGRYASSLAELVEGHFFVNDL